jgi:hypothetical protein
VIFYRKSAATKTLIGVMSNEQAACQQDWTSTSGNGVAPDLLCLPLSSTGEKIADRFHGGRHDVPTLHGVSQWMTLARG